MRGFSTTLAVLVVLTSLAALPMASGGSFGDCSGDIIQLGLGDATPYGTVYHVIVGDTPLDAWSYIEINEEAGLQRGGLGWGNNDNCQESENPDFMWY